MYDKLQCTGKIHSDNLIVEADLENSVFSKWNLNKQNLKITQRQIK